MSAERADYHARMLLDRALRIGRFALSVAPPWAVWVFKAIRWPFLLARHLYIQANYRLERYSLSIGRLPSRVFGLILSPITLANRMTAALVQVTHELPRLHDEIERLRQENRELHVTLRDLMEDIAESNRAAPANGASSSSEETDS